MADVFISYKRERRAAAKHLAEIIKLHGFSVWFDYELKRGPSFRDQIEKELKASTVVLVLWCSRSIESRWVHEEAHYAQRKKHLLPIKIEEVDLPLGYQLSETLELADWDGLPRSHLLDPLFRQIAGYVGRDVHVVWNDLVSFEERWRDAGAYSPTEMKLQKAMPAERGRLLQLDDSDEEDQPQPDDFEQQSGVSKDPVEGVQPPTLPKPDPVSKSVDRLVERDPDGTRGEIRNRPEATAASRTILRDAIANDLAASAKSAPANAPPASPPPQGGWLRDVLRNAQASNAAAAPPTPAPERPLSALTDEIAASIDHPALKDAWERYQQGEQNVFSRRIYTLKGQSTYDEVRKRVQRDSNFSSIAAVYMSEFEQLLRRASEAEDAFAEVIGVLTSDRGKVYTMLAHASGRLG